MQPPGEVVLESLEFTRAEIEVGESLVVLARTAEDREVGPQPFVIEASSGARQQRCLSRSQQDGGRSYWAAFTNDELASLIAKWDNVVMIGFKEEDASRGVDEQGRVLVLEETVNRMTKWVQEQGVTITREFVFLPGVVGTMPAKAELVGKIREHKNIDYLEAAPPGGFLGIDGRPGEKAI
jgi:hypothetical protein